jgi:two-component system, cell cycle sensor histidine kinase and response regulator CckA
MTHQKQTDQVQQRLNAQLERREQELVALYEIGQKFISTFDLELIYQTMYDEIGQRLLGAPHLVVALVDEATETVVCDFAIIDGERVEPTLFPPIPLHQGMTGEIVSRRQPRIVDLEQERARINPQHQAHIGDEKLPMSGLYVPLITGDKVVGTLNVQHYEVDAFSEIDLTLLAILANQAAAAIQNAQLYQQVQNQAVQITQIMDSVPDGVLLLNEQQQVLVANPVGQAFLSLLADVKIGETVTQLSDYALNELLVRPATGQWRTFTYGKGTKERVFEVIARALVADAAATGWVIVLREVTESRLVQQQLKKQERLAAVGQLAAGIAHDFNNMLSVILLYTQMVSGSPQLTDPDRGRLSTVSQQAEHAAHMIQQILDFSRRSVLERQSIDLWSVIHEQVGLLQHTLPEHIEILVEGKPGQYLVQADPTRIQQIIVNLAVNARDAMLQGGQLIYRLEQIQLQQNDKRPLPNMPDGAWIQLTVRDTGVGIAPESMDHIFEPFFTTKAPGEGTGLGLAQVHGIVAQHQGYITVESELEQGTAVIIYLPALTLPAVSRLNVQPETEPKGQGQLILVVEDNTILRQSLVDYLQIWQYQTVEAANGEEALDQLAQYGEAITLILSDVVMPRMGGLELFKAVRQRGYNTPMLVLTGHPLQDKDIGVLRGLGIYAWLNKPPDITRLSQLIAQAVAN